MKSWVDTAASALISGTAASLAMTAALALLAKKEGKGALQPTNSTSHCVAWRRSQLHQIIGRVPHWIGLRNTSCLRSILGIYF